MAKFLIGNVKGTPGATGAKGDTGKGIKNIQQVSNEAKIIIIYDDNTTSDPITIPTIKGDKGDSGTTDFNDLINKPTTLLGYGITDAVVKVDGKGLSTNDFTTEEKTKLESAVTKAVNDLENYYNKTSIDEMLESLTGLSIEVVNALPTTEISTGTIYLVPSENPTTNDVKDEYLYVNGAWEKIGSTSIDLTGYVTDEDLTAALADYVEKVEGKGLSANDFTNAYKEKLDGLNIKSISVNNTAQSVDDNGNVNLTFGAGNDYTVVINPSDWSQVSGQTYYSAVKTVTGIKATDNPIVDIVPTLAGYEAEIADWSKLIKAETAENIITFYASEAFTNAVSVLVKVV